MDHVADHAADLATEGPRTLRSRLAFWRRRGERGASAVEYGILIAGIAAVIVLAVVAFGDSVNNLFGDTCSTIDKVGPGECKETPSPGTTP
ncbi:Flp family type IVb pilin [Nocardioides sp. GXZ039]|uniref:Flp family type IVb pilin n=1 Tax=Nocardioides sp. GXZ039 TaxID=3136018 RepID=UPI0030F47E6C